MTWPVSHDWSSSYIVTYSFKTEVLVSRSGREQRRALRPEPRRTLQTSFLETTQALDTWLWQVQAEISYHYDPVTGSRSTVRLPDAITVSHPTSVTANGSITLQVEPGTDTPPSVEPDASSTFSGRYVLPYRINWVDGVPDALAFPRQSVDFDSGRIAVTRPVAFGSRTTTRAYLRETPDTIDQVVDFFLWARGRQRDFWMPSALDDVTLSGETVSEVLPTIRSFAGVVQDGINIGLRIETTGGHVFYRLVQSVGEKFIALTREVPQRLAPDNVRRISWLRLGRFASDDLSVEWVTNEVARMQVQTVTLPYRPPDGPLFAPDVQAVLDYFGTNFYGSLYGDPLDYLVNVQIPRAGGELVLQHEWQDALDYLVNHQIGAS